MIHWLTTQPNPRSSATGVDAGQRGWRLHAVETERENFTDIKHLSAICGVRPKFGWGLDMFIEDHCSKCEARLHTRHAAPDERHRLPLALPPPPA